MSDAITRPLEYWASGGPLLIPIALTCFAIWFYFLRCRSGMLSAIRGGDTLYHELSARLRGGGNLSRVPGLLSRVMEQVAVDIDAGCNPRQVLDVHESTTLKRLEKDLVVLAALTAAAPLLGLLGTVAGMIETFDAVSAAGDTAGRVASGISQALITTQFGLVVAIPGVFGLAYLRRLHAQAKMRFAVCRSHVLMAVERAAEAEA
jgi:biopolymer transport protein ExbB